MVASSMISFVLFIAVTSRFFVVHAAPLTPNATPIAGPVYPTAPVAASNYTTGQTCHIAWNPATQPAPADWKSMTIQLMSGSNSVMIPLETVATNQDATVAGSFDHICPDVSENARIYFYQFTCTGCTTAWTTRFLIAGANGQTVAPDNDGADQGGIPWGTGTIIGSSTVALSSSITVALSLSTTVGSSTKVSSSITTTRPSTTANSIARVTSSAIVSSSPTLSAAVVATATPTGNPTWTSSAVPTVTPGPSSILNGVSTASSAVASQTTRMVSVVVWSSSAALPAYSGTPNPANPQAGAATNGVGNTIGLNPRFLAVIFVVLGAAMY